MLVNILILTVTFGSTMAGIVKGRDNRGTERRSRRLKKKSAASALSPRTGEDLQRLAFFIIKLRR